MLLSALKVDSAIQSRDEGTKQMSNSETKKMMAPNRACDFKYKTKKQVNWDHPGKASYSRKRTTINKLYRDNGAMKSCMDRAEEVLQSIPVEYPKFSMQMIQSNVFRCFWLILPADFCKSYMPKNDAIVILVDDFGEEKETKYFAKRGGLSAGWRRFAIDHTLLEGDILVFHMIAPYKLRVHIVRCYGPNVTEAARRCGLDTTNAALLLMGIHNSEDGTYSNQSESRDDDWSDSGDETCSDQSESGDEDWSPEVPEA